MPVAGVIAQPSTCIVFRLRETDGIHVGQLLERSDQVFADGEVVLHDVGVESLAHGSERQGRARATPCS